MGSLVEAVHIIRYGVALGFGLIGGVFLVLILTRIKFT